MSTAAATGWSAGARRIQVAMRDARGYPLGTLKTPDSPVNGTTTSAHVISGLRSLTHPQKSIARAFDKGDSKVYGQMFLGVDDYGEGTFEVGAEDEIFEALIKKTGVDVTLATDMAIRADNASLVDPPAMFLLATTRKQLRDGTFWYDTHMYNNVLIRKSQDAAISQAGGESPAPLQYTFVPSLSSRLISGHLLSATDLDVLEDEDTCIRIRSRYPLAVTTFIADGTDTTVQLPFVPVYAGATGSAQNIITRNGVSLAVTSVNTVSGLVTLAAAGAAGDVFVFLYQTLFKPVA